MSLDRRALYEAVYKTVYIYIRLVRAQISGAWPRAIIRGKGPVDVWPKMFLTSLLRFLISTGIIAAAYDGPKFIGKNIQWTGGNNIEWPCATTKNMNKSSGQFISKNVIATRAAIYKDEAFIALPRYGHSINVTTRPPLVQVQIPLKYS